MVEIPKGSDYRFLYIFLYNREIGTQWKIAEPTDQRNLSQILVDNGYEMIYHPAFDGDIAVGSKDGTVVGVATVFGMWAIDLTDHTPVKEPTND